MTIQWLCYSVNPENYKTINDFLINKGYPLLFQRESKEIKKLLQLNPHAVVIIDVYENEDCYQYCEDLSTLYPQTYVVLAGEERAIDVMKALHCGAKDILYYSSKEETLMEVIKRAEKHLQSKGSHPSPKIANHVGRTITVCSTKGGVGKTTLIVNLATILSKQNYRVAVLDLNLQFGDVSLYYDVKPRKTIYEWVKEDYGAPTLNLSNYMVRHRSGVEILPAPIRPEFSEAINEEHILALINECKILYDYILIDTPPYLTEHTLISLEKSNDILLMTFMDLATLKNNKIFIETLDALSLKDKVKVILNRHYKVKGIQPETVSKILELPIYARIPNKEKHITTSINEGIPFVLTNSRNSFSKAINILASQLSGDPIKSKKTKKKPLQPN